MIVFVVGLYKSGTSLIASMLEEIGCESIVDRVATTKGLTREYDIKESYFVNQLNNKILATYSNAEIYFKNEDLPEVIDEAFTTLIRDFLAQLKGRTVFIKDPRFIGTLKYWIDNIPEGEQYKIVYVDREDGLESSFRIDKWFNNKIVDGDYRRAIDSLKSNYYQTRSQFKGIEIDFDTQKKDQVKLGHLLYNFITQDFDTTYKVYFHNYFLPSKELTELFSKQTPGSSGVWKNLIAVDDINQADYEVAQDRTDGKYHASKLIFFGREPRHIYFHDIPQAAYNFHHEKGNSHMPQTWWVNRTYDEILSNTSTDKPHLLSIIDSGKLGVSGHNKRVEVVDKLHTSSIDLHIYGKTTRYTDEKYLGELPARDKTDGLIPYRFNLAIENGQTDLYFSEKFCDPVLCNTFPIYVGCKQIDRFFPKGSYFTIDLDKDVIAQVRDITSIPVEQLDYSALFEAKDLILNKYNIWDTIHRVIHTGKTL
jgi:hypothetical protein